MVAAVGLLFGLVLAAGAAADLKDICPSGSGAGQCSGPVAVAVDSEAGTLFVVDAGNNRIDVFEADGTFVRAFGWGVADGVTSALQVCTTTCFKGLSGGGGGQFSNARAIAVDNDPGSGSHHDVYVFDGSNRRVQKFSPTGAFERAWGWDVVASGPHDDTVAPVNEFEVCVAGEDVCKAGVSGTGAGQFNAASNPVALGPAGMVYVGGQGAASQSRVQKFDPEGGLVSVFALKRDECEKGGPSNQVPLLGSLFGLAVDAAGNFLASPGIHKYDPAGNLLEPCDPVNPSSNINAIALDQAGKLYVGDSTGVNEGGETAVYLYDPAAEPLHTLYGNGTLSSRPISLAPYSNAGGDLFVVEGSNPARVSQIAIEPPGPVVLPLAGSTGTRVSELGNVRATLNAWVSPEGKASEVHFQYVEDAAYQKDLGEGGDGFGGSESFETDPGETLPTSIPPSGENPFKAYDTHFAISCPKPEVELAKKLEDGICLKAETVYRFRAIAVNADGEDVGPVASFKTLPPIQPGPAWSSEVGAQTARLHGQLNPTGIPASLHFQYVEDAAYQKDLGEGGDGFTAPTQTPELDLGAGEETVARSALISSLTPGTAYRFRYLAQNLFGVFPGPTRVFKTTEGPLGSSACPNEELRIGPAAELSDCRAYELVSPVDKEGADVRPPHETLQTALGASLGRIAQSTPAGDAMSYASFQAFGDVDSVHFATQYIGRRDPTAGWSAISVNHPREGPSLVVSPGAATTTSPFWAFSEDLCSDWFVQETDLALVEGAPPGVPHFYRRLNCLGGGGCPIAGQLTEDCYELLSTTPPPGFGKEAEATSFYRLGLGGFSEDGAIAAFKAPAALTPEAHVVPLGTKLRCDVTATGASISYRWQRNGVPITPVSSADDPEYTMVAADAGKAVQCQVFAVNEDEDEASGGFVGATQVSNPAQVVAPLTSLPPIAPALIPAPQTSGPLTVGGGGGQTLTCDPREADWEGAPSFSYQWYRNGAKIAGASEPTYLTSAGNLATAAAFQCVVSATNAGGTVLAVSATLTTDPAPKPMAPNPKPRVLDIYRVYLHDEVGLHLVSVLPDGSAARTHAAVGTAQETTGARLFESVAGAVAVDGSRVFWSAQTKEPSPPAHGGYLVAPSRLYLRANPAEQQSALSGEQCTEAAKACTIAIGSGAAVFRAANPSASKAIFSEGEDLYEIDVDKALAYDAGAKTKIAGQVKGVMGWSEDLSHVYLVSGEDLDGAGPAQVGKFNLYLYEAGAGFAFVAELLGDGWKSSPRPEDGTSSDVRSFSPFPVNRSSRVSADGLHAAFMSDSLQLAEATAGYDNTDANSGEADSEVYLYDAEEGELRCVSCNPSGERPEGQDVIADSREAWTAAKIPGWETQWHASRLLSPDGGRLFFESLEALVPRDDNGKQDVYEWERANSKAECEALGAERYVPANGGCLSLISSGTSPVDSEVLDASQTGDDVFFTTASSLVPQDPGLFDIYDARVGGGFPYQEGKESECEGEACQSPPAPSEAPTPASSAFEGEGNVPPSARKPRCPAGKRRARRAGRVRCVAKHKRRHGHAAKRRARRSHR